MVTLKNYDVIAYLNGDKRSNIKKRICDIIYYPQEVTDIRIYSGKAISDIEKIDNISNDETIDTCFNVFLQQKILGFFKYLGKYKEETAYERGEFNRIIDNCRKKFIPSYTLCKA